MATPAQREFYTEVFLAGGRKQRSHGRPGAMGFARGLPAGASMD